MIDSQPRNLQISGDVREALAAGRAVVALESTIISHGMPYPRNVETAREVEEVVRSRGGVPATVAIFDGAFHVGLRDEEIERLGREEGVMKVSRRDLGIVLATHRTGATTVATTMIGAHLAGIRLFATGGTGGVHRGYQETLDVSADLPELGRTPVAVVSAGVKSILDIPRTLEYLETLGVPVITYRSDEFPAFYSRESGLPAPLRLDSPESVAATLAAHWSIPSAGG
ncbi:MAG: pseudouridine-5'-phosphate glycosidase, partial [Alkalispirochaeta sp.]